VEILAVTVLHLPFDFANTLEIRHITLDQCLVEDKTELGRILMILREFPQHGQVLLGDQVLKPLQLGKKKSFVKACSSHSTAHPTSMLFY
jgi:hypothetical protein